MFETLSSILPLDIASTLSPLIFAITIVLLSDESHRKAKLTAFFIGSLIVGIIITSIGFNLGQKTLAGGKQSNISSIADLIIGVFFIFFAIKSLLSKERKVHIQDYQQGRKILKWFGIGIIVNATNFDALFLNLTAAKEVGIAGLSLTVKTFFLCLNLLFFTLPISFPIVLYIIFPVVATRILARINRFLFKYCKYIIAVMFILLAIIFLERGLVFFL
ncbi:MAG: GAP family protein [Patescibacteria group bacterium]|nr:GAP family protein [Actinomycetota bacterium]MCL5438642.1 GAP family protein [Patescibacteria group bacterium]